MNSVLLVDDDPVSNFITERSIKELSFCDNVVVYRDAQGALGFLDNLSKTNDLFPNLILFDLYMPKLNGFEFINTLKSFNCKNSKDITFIAVTNSINPKDYEKLSAIGIHNILKKPVTKVALSEILKLDLTSSPNVYS